MLSGVNVFVPAHDWQHAIAPSRYSIGRTVTAVCECGAKSVAIVTRGDGKIDSVDVEGGDRMFCPHTGRDKREVC